MDRFTLKQARNLAGLTQVEVADRLNVNEGTYLKYENYQTLLRIDKAYTFSKIVGLEISSIIFFQKELQKNCS